MNNPKKFIYTILLCLLLSGRVHIHAIPAAALPILSASADLTSATQNDIVFISVQLENNPDLSTLGIALHYDSSLLQYSGSTWSSQFFGSDLTMASDTGNAVNLSFVCEGSYPSDGTIVTVSFKALENISSIPVTLSLRDMSDADLTSVTNCRVIQEIQVPTQPDTTHTDKSQLEAMDIPDTKHPDSTETKNTAKPAVHTSIPAADPEQNIPQNASDGQADENYKTGAGLSSDILLLVSVLCGVSFLGLLVVKTKREGSL